MLGRLTNIIENTTKKMFEQIQKEKEKILIEAYNQEHKYLAIRTITTLEEDNQNFEYKGTIKYKYLGFESALGLDVLKEQGYEIYDLTNLNFNKS